MKRIVIYNEEMGIYLGNALGLGFWSKLDAVGQYAAVTFECRDDAVKHIQSWNESNNPDEYSFVLVEPSEQHGAEWYASIENCVEAGLPGWDPNWYGKQE
jgi:hypothetical protein